MALERKIPPAAALFAVTIMEGATHASALHSSYRLASRGPLTPVRELSFLICFLDRCICQCVIFNEAVQLSIYLYTTHCTEPMKLGVHLHKHQLPVELTGPAVAKCAEPCQDSKQQHFMHIAALFITSPLALVHARERI